MCVYMGVCVSHNLGKEVKKGSNPSESLYITMNALIVGNSSSRRSIIRWINRTDKDTAEMNAENWKDTARVRLKQQHI